MSAASRTFAHHDVADGLSSDTVYSITQDRTGFIWVATSDGLNRFDGERFVDFHTSPKDREGFTLSSLLIDRRGTMWIATWGGGLDRHDSSGRHVDFIRRAEYQGALGDDRIQTLFEDSRGAIWVGTFAGGLTRIDPVTRAMTHWSRSSRDRRLSDDRVWAIAENGGAMYAGTSRGLDRIDASGKSESVAAFDGEIVRALHFDRDGRLWIGKENGVARLETTGALSEAASIRPIVEAIGKEAINAILEDSTGNLWFATRASGLFRFDPKQGSVEHLPGNPNVPGAMKRSDVRTLFEDRSQVLWIGTRGGGLHRFDLKPPKFSSMLNDPADPSTVSAGAATFIESAGGILIGTDVGIDRFDPVSRTITHLWQDPANLLSGVGDVSKLSRDSQGSLWIATWDSGLFRIDDAGTRKHFRAGDAPGSISANRVNDVVEAGAGRMWVATTGGLDLLDRDAGMVRSYRHDARDPRSLSENLITAVLRDRNGTLWVGTDNEGLDRLERDGSGFVHYRRGPPGGISSNQIRDIFEDRDGMIWVSTTNGLNRIDPRAGVTRQYFASNGLPSSRVSGVIDDEQGNLWIATSGGLTRLDPRTQRMRTYRLADGLHAPAVAFGFRDRTGMLYFGGGAGAGITWFRPSEVRDNPHAPAVVITGFWPSSNPGATASAPGQSLRLSHEDNMFTIAFAGLEFTAPERNRYAYKLEPLETEWVEAGERRLARYVGVRPGQYTFRVKAANADGIWSESGGSLKIEVTPPWWQTNTARAGAVLVVALLIVLLHRWRTHRIERRNRELEAVIEARTEELKEYASKLQEHAQALEVANRRILEADRAKSNFLAMMSHELRTPLNSIIGFADILASRWKDRENLRELSFVNNISESGQHLLNLINNLLDLSKIEAGKMDVYVEPIVVSDLVAGVSSIVSGMATRRTIEIRSSVAPDLPPLNADSAKLKQILYNLISNAVKFSPDRSTVEIDVRRLTAAASPLNLDSVEFRISDHGPGITPADQQMIFEEFRQTRGGATAPGGTGLGLAIVRKLTELQGGLVTVDSIVGSGSTFHVFLPLHVRERTTTRRDSAGAVRDGQRTVLVVEDDESFRERVAAMLEAVGYRAVCIGRGEEVLPLVRELRPAVITLDILLPGIDGWQVLKALKNDPECNGIPVVIITAIGDKELGLALGADDLFVKPIDDTLLLQSVRRLVSADDFAHPSVLVIDDDPFVHELIRSALVPRGYEVISADRGELGFDLAAAIRPSLIVLDLMMPVMNGFEVAARLRDNPRTAAIPLVVLTSKDLSAQERSQLGGKISALLSKGSSPAEELIRTVQQLERRRDVEAG